MAERKIRRPPKPEPLPPHGEREPSKRDVEDADAAHTERVRDAHLQRRPGTE